jgi:hypothetical protein
VEKFDYTKGFKALLPGMWTGWGVVWRCGWWWSAHGCLVGSLAPTPLTEESPVRASTLLNCVLDLPGVRVRGVEVGAGGRGVVVVTVGARRGVLRCPLCEFTTRRV